MSRKEIKGKKQNLVKILKEEDEKIRLNKSVNLAKGVGASTTRIVSITTESGIGTLLSNEITETEVVQNIQQALQTETMIDMRETAAKNFWIAMVAAIAAVLTATVALVAVLAI